MPKTKIKKAKQIDKINQAEISVDKEFRKFNQVRKSHDQEMFFILDLSFYIFLLLVYY